VCLVAHGYLLGYGDEKGVLMASTYDIGDEIRITSSFLQGIVPVDPATVSLVVKLPDGSSSTYTYAGSTLIKDSVGNYHKDLTIASSGTYYYRWTSTGTGAASQENWFQVRVRKVP